MNLNELAVAVLGAGLITAAYRRSVADHGLRRTAEDQTAAAGGHDHRIGRKGADLHAHQVLADAAAALAVFVEERRQEVPELPLGDPSFRLPPPHLLVQCIQQLLPGGGARRKRYGGKACRRSDGGPGNPLACD